MYLQINVPIPGHTKHNKKLFTFVIACKILGTFGSPDSHMTHIEACKHTHPSVHTHMGYIPSKIR